MATRIGADIGGTFTDSVLYDDTTGNTLTGKVPTTTNRPEIGCLAAIDAVADAKVLARCRYFLHGTTVGLNAILQRRGATVGLITTEGFRDVLEIRRGTRERIYDPFWAPPAPLVRRSLRLGVRERICSNGTVLTTVDEQSLRAIRTAFENQGVNSIAVCLMNAYANSANELEVECQLRQMGFAGPISLSHRLSGEYGEFERTSTTVIDAFVSAEMRGYLERLEKGLRERGFQGTALITRSGGGAMTFAEALQRSFETIMSGPVAGTAGTAELSRRHNLPEMITADVGGTSFDTCVIRNGEPDLLFEGNIEGMPLQSSWVDVRSIGAGGGSIAYVDREGALRVGPRSSGSMPGPACYGRGGTEPTLTDAEFHLGMLGEGHLASGLKLDRIRADKALTTLAERLGTTVERTAIGIVTVAAANMASAIREITVERGMDPRRMYLTPFGGAGPLLAINIARDLEMSQIIVPPFAGNFSAWGLLGADIVRDTSKTFLAPLDAAALTRVNAVLRKAYNELEGEGPDGQATNTQAGAQSREAFLDLRYKGQEYTLSIRIPLQGGAVSIEPPQIRELFETKYLAFYGGTLSESLEIAAVRAAIRRQLPRYSSTAADTVVEQSNGTRHCAAYSFTQGRLMDFQVVSRSELRQDETVRGPLIILEPTATTYVDTDCEVKVAADGSLFMTLDASEPAR